MSDINVRNAPVSCRPREGKRTAKSDREATSGVKSRIRRVAILSAGVALVLFLLPLGYAVMNLSLAEARAGLDASALHAALKIDPTFSGSDRTEIPRPPSGQGLALYDAMGTLVVGVGPRQGDSAVRAALAGRPAPEIVDGSLVVVVPTASAEAITGAVRSSVPLASVWARITASWAIMVVLALGAVAIGVLVARSSSGRIVAPIEELARISRALGDGDFTVRMAPTGLAEIDAAGSALNASAHRLNEAMSRERALTSQSSHQLRTPLAGLRALFENALADPRTDLRATIRQGLERADSLEATIDDILELGRGAPGGVSVDLVAAAEQAAGRWNGAFAAVGRPLRLELEPGILPVLAAEASLRQLLDILLENSLRHGRGDVVLRVRTTYGAAAIDVEDAGNSIDGDHDVFAGGFSTDGGSGIGLALARQLVSDHGGQLVLTSRAPRTRFTAIFIEAPVVATLGK